MKKKYIISLIVVLIIIILGVIILSRKGELDLSNSISINYNDDNMSLELDKEVFIKDNPSLEEYENEITISPSSFSYEEINDNELNYTILYGNKTESEQISYDKNEVINKIEEQIKIKEDEISSLEDEVTNAEDYHEERLEKLQENYDDLGSGILANSTKKQLDEEKNKDRTEWYAEGSKESIGDLEKQVSSLADEVSSLEGQIDKFENL